MVFKMKGNPFKQNKDNSFKSWAEKQKNSGKFIKEAANNSVGYTWKTNDGTNRSLRQVYEGITRVQGSHNSPIVE
jgi:hypothetical protein